MRLCCDTFDYYLSRAGSDEFAVVARKCGDLRGFFVQFRICAREQEPLLQNLPRDGDLPRPLHIGGQVGIQFCPFCGFDLESCIKENLEWFDRLAEGHQEFVFDPLQ